MISRIMDRFTDRSTINNVWPRVNELGHSNIHPVALL